MLNRLHRQIREKNFTGKLKQKPSMQGKILKAIQKMYGQFPFPPPQRRYSYKNHAIYVYKLFKKLKINPDGQTFADIACGTGLMMLDYALQFPKTKFIGYDIGSKSVEIANKNFKRENVNARAKSYLKNILNIKDSERFTYIVSWGTIHHLSDPEKGIHLLCRALKSGGILRTGIYGYYGNWERRIQQEIVDTILKDSMDFEARINLVQAWIKGDKTFKNIFTAPPVDVRDKNWIVDEFLHVWEQHLKLKDVIKWLKNENMKIICLTDYYDNEISLDIRNYSTNAQFIKRVLQLPFEHQCHLIDLIVRPYWISLIAQKT